jgi:hypothetical protein
MIKKFIDQAIKYLNIISLILIILTMAVSLQSTVGLAEKIAVFAYLSFALNIILLVIRHIFNK